MTDKTHRSLFHEGLNILGEHGLDEFKEWVSDLTEDEWEGVKNLMERMMQYMGFCHCTLERFSDSGSTETITH